MNNSINNNNLNSSPSIALVGSSTANTGITNTSSNYTLAPSIYTTLNYANDTAAIYSGYCSEILIEKLFSYLSEKEVDELFEKIMKRDKALSTNKDKEYSFVVRSTSDTQCIIKEYVCHNHCSEDFLIKYYNKQLISKLDIYNNHQRYIVSGEYSNLALLFEVEEK